MLDTATTENFHLLVSQPSYQTPVLVDFGASWCGPCKALHPLLERFAHEYAGRVKVVTVDIDAEPALAERFKITTVPTMILVRHEWVVATHLGNPGSVAGIREVMGL